MLEEHNQSIERSRAVMHKVQTTYQMQVANYELQATAATILIRKLKKEKEALAEKADMDIRIIITGWHKILQENAAVIWG